MKNKILVVDDEEAILLALHTLLELEGFDVAVATNGRIGFERYREFAPDLVLVDVMMPELTGYELVRLIRQDKKSFDTKIIYLTAKGMEANRREGYATGADDYLIKPYSIQELIETVRGVLQA
jgi:DNA-binding response OmpR family regulator